MVDKIINRGGQFWIGRDIAVHRLGFEAAQVIQHLCRVIDVLFCLGRSDTGPRTGPCLSSIAVSLQSLSRCIETDLNHRETHPVVFAPDALEGQGVEHGGAA